MLTLNKTKAALPSCQCHNKELNQSQHTRPYAGGQSLTVPVNTGALNFPQWGELLGIEISADPNVLHWRELFIIEILGANNLHGWWKLPSNRVANLQLATYTQQGYTPASHTTKEIAPIVGRLLFNRGRNCAYHDRYPEFGYRYKGNRNGQLFFSSSRSSFCFALNLLVASARIATRINFEGVSPSYITCSTNSITSCGTRRVTERDLEFTGPVGIPYSSVDWCKTLYTKKSLEEGLRCKTLNVSFVLHLFVSKVQITKPDSVGALIGPLTTNRYSR